MRQWDGIDEFLPVATAGSFIGAARPQGELRVTCSTAMGERFVAPILRRFAMPYPRLSVGIDLTNRVVDMVAECYDLAVRCGPGRWRTRG